MIRLQKLLSQSGIASRREAERLIVDGAVTVNGMVVTEMGTQVDPDRDRVELRGRRVQGDTPVYRLLLKPRACLSSLTARPDEKGRPRPSIRRYVLDADLPWKVVGPLDFPSEGVLLLTTDGELAERLSKDKGRLSMCYHLKFQGSVGDVEVARLDRGWTFEGRAVKPTSVELLATTGKNTWAEIVVADMRPRALHAAGLVIRRHVLKISRTKFGDMSFEGLKMGGHRDLNVREVGALRQAAGLR